MKLFDFFTSFCPQTKRGTYPYRQRLSKSDNDCHPFHLSVECDSIILTVMLDGLAPSLRKCFLLQKQRTIKTLS